MVDQQSANRLWHRLGSGVVGRFADAGGLAKVTRRKAPFRTSAADFVGREEEVHEIAGDIDYHRLIFRLVGGICG
jgi:hypothetical protein